MDNELNLQDYSDDKKYFTMLPNYILNHSTAIDQALYMQMKKVSGEYGECFLSERTLMQKLGIGNKALKKSIQYLLKRGWIKENGFIVRETNGGKQKVKSYKIIDIWKFNIEHYQGASESIPLDRQGASESSVKVLSKVSQGASESATNKNPIIKTYNKKESIFEIPENINKQSWNEWVSYRGEIKKKMTPATIKAQIKLLKDFSFDEQSEIINKSIANGWTGLFPPKTRIITKSIIEK